MRMKEPTKQRGKKKEQLPNSRVESTTLERPTDLPSTDPQLATQNRQRIGKWPQSTDYAYSFS
jgi:hypothetical protein